MIGRTLNTYRIVRQLGHGGMGAVYEAEDLRLGRRVALKLLPGDLTADVAAGRRFEQEARTVASLNHPHIVAIYSFEEAEGIHFITMERIDGETLSAALPAAGYPLPDLYRLAIPLADALAAAGAQGIVHRDLKPGNLMIDAHGRIKVLDFGLARRMTGRASADDADAIASLTRPGEIVGTVHYMSPEQLQNESLDPRSDIFSLGIILYQMTTGRHPFEGTSQAARISAILRDAPPAVTAVNPELPRHLGRIIEHCLHKDRERRFQTAADVRNELRDLQREQERDEILADAKTQAAPVPLGPDSAPVEVASVQRDPSGPESEIVSVQRDPSGPESGDREPGPPQQASGPVSSAPPDAEGVARPARRRALLPLAAALFLALGGLGWWFNHRSAATPFLSGVAVLPFANHLGDPARDYLAAGVSSALISQLSRLRGVQVVGQQETWAAVEAEPSARGLASRLGVGTLVEGDVGESASGLAVNMRVVDGATGRILWSRRVEGPAEEIYRLETDLATDLTEFLAIPMSAGERRRLRHDPTRSTSAYDSYLRGRRLLTERPQDPGPAIENLRQALRLDDDFALAHVALSEALQRRYVDHDHESATLDEAEAEAERALEIDPDLPEGLVNLARLYATTSRHEDSLAKLETALARHPKPDEAYRALAYTEQLAGDLEAARKALRAAVALGPERWMNWNAFGSFLFETGDYDGARQAYEAAAARAPDGMNWPLENLAAIAIMAEDWDLAIQIYDRIEAPGDATLATNRGTAYFFSGDLVSAEKHFRLAVEFDPRDHVARRNLADLLMLIGDESGALEQYRQAREQADRELVDRPDDQDLGTLAVLYAARTGECATALEDADALAARLTPAALNSHNLAQAYAVCGATERALDHLERAVEGGFPIGFIDGEAEFDSLRDAARYHALGDLPTSGS